MGLGQDSKYALHQLFWNTFGPTNGMYLGLRERNISAQKFLNKMSSGKHGSRYSMGKLWEGEQWGLRKGCSSSSSGDLISRATKSKRTIREVTQQQECKMKDYQPIM